jgi:hypothetical protein
MGHPLHAVEGGVGVDAALRRQSPPPCLRARTGSCKAAPPPAQVTTWATPSTLWRGRRGRCRLAAAVSPSLSPCSNRFLQGRHRALVLRTGAQRAQAGMQDRRWQWAASWLAANPRPSDGRSTGPGKDVAIFSPARPKSACPKDKGASRVATWPTGPLDHRDKEPRWRAEGAAKGRRPPPQRGGGGRGGNPGRGRGRGRGARQPRKYATVTPSPPSVRSPGR